MKSQGYIPAEALKKITCGAYRQIFGGDEKTFLAFPRTAACGEVIQAGTGGLLDTKPLDAEYNRSTLP